MHKFPYKTWLLAVLLLLLPCAVQAAGLGKLNVLSSLGQPLQAEIDLISVDKDELSSMTARLASPEAYTQANVPYSSALVGVLVSIEKRADGQPYIKVTSIRAVNDPFIDFLIELNWAQGKLVRQYTALIDPPGFTLPGVAAPPMAVAPPTAAPTETKPIESAPAAAAPAETPPAAAAPAEGSAPAEGAAAQPEGNKNAETPAAAEEKPAEAKPEEAAKTPAAEPAPSEYTVKHGDTLYRIAMNVKPEGVTVEQMLVSLYRSNPKAFVGNMNRLKAGKILRIPEEDQIAETTQSKAVKEIRVQTASWNAYRKSLAEAAAATPAEEEEKSTSGKITTKVEDQTTAGKTPQEVLKLSKGETTTDANGKPLSPKERINALEEEATAREKALTEANDRVTQLEQQIKDMQHLLELKGVKVPAAAPGAALPMKSETAVAEPPKAEPAVAPAGEPVTAAPAQSEAPPAAATPATVPAPQPPPKPAPKKPKVVTPPPGLMDEILSNPLYLAAGGGALVLLGGIGYLATRRRQSADKGDSKSGVKKNAPHLNKSVTDTATSSPSAIQAAMSQTVAMPAVEADDVDPLQEADLYLNFGRDAQAEEVLKEALEKNPKNEEAQLKLLQIYAGRKDKTEFEKTARRLKDLTSGKGDKWLKAAALGYSFDSGNALYAAGKSSAAPAAAAVPAAGVDLDFGTDVTSQSAATAKTELDLETSPVTTTLLQPGVAAQAEIEDITHDSAAGSGNIVTDITFDAPIEESGTKTDVKTDVALESGAAPVNMIDFSLDTPSASGDKGFSPDKTMVMNLGSPDKKASSSMDLDLGTAKNAPLAPDLKLDFGDAMTAPPSALKLDDINLNLDDVAPGKPEDGGKDEQWSDIQTKFDLAKAYQEMGDKDGAREILREVIKQGDAKQQEEAKKLLDSLG